MQQTGSSTHERHKPYHTVHCDKLNAFMAIHQSSPLPTETKGANPDGAAAASASCLAGALLFPCCAASTFEEMKFDEKIREP
jgi:hypothetical protein